MKRLQRIAALLLTAVLLVIAGCSSGIPPKAALQDAMAQMMNVDSYSAAISIAIDELELAADTSQQEGFLSRAVIAGMLKGAVLNVNAVYHKEPMRTDMELDLVLSGLTLTIPMILSEQKLYVQVPNIPMLPLPENIIGKYIEIDIEALAAQQDAPASLDAVVQQQFAQELGMVFLKHFDEKTYFSGVKIEDADLPDNIKADQVVKFSLNETNYQQSVEMIVTKLLPELIDVLASNDAYLQSAHKSKEDVEKMKADLTANQAEMIARLKNDVKLNELSILGAIQNKFLVYEAGKVDVLYTDKDSGNASKLGFQFNVAYSDINQAPKFTKELPSDAVKLEDLAKQLQLPVGL